MAILFRTNVPRNLIFQTFVCFQVTDMASELNTVTIVSKILKSFDDETVRYDIYMLYLHVNPDLSHIHALLCALLCESGTQ